MLLAKHYNRSQEQKYISSEMLEELASGYYQGIFCGAIILFVSTEGYGLW